MYGMNFKATQSKVVAAMPPMVASAFLALDLLPGFVPEFPLIVDGERTARFLPVYLAIRDDFLRDIFADFSPIVVIAIGTVIAGGLLMSTRRTGANTMDEPVKDHELARRILSDPQEIAKNPEAFFENNAKIFAEMQSRNPNFGKATAPKAIDPMLAVHELDLNITHQCGFDYYFSEESREELWNAAHQGLNELGLSDLAAVFMRAEHVFRANEQAREEEYNRVGDAAFDRDESDYLRAMAAIDAEWRMGIAQLHAKLAPWRATNGPG